MKNEDFGLWGVFSEYIRLRDADKDGYIRCCTCRRFLHWKESDAGHFIGRQHKSVKYHEKNVHAQCKACNCFEAGNNFEYGQFINRKYGEGAAELLLSIKKQVCKLGRFEYEQLKAYYKEEIKKLRSAKNI